MTVLTAEALGVPERFNAANHFVDRNSTEGRGAAVAIECGEQRVTYETLRRNVNRFAGALCGLGVRREERVLLLLSDGPAFAYAFFGAIKAGAVPIPLNTLWKAADYGHVLEDSSPAALIVSPELHPQITPALTQGRSPKHIVLAGGTFEDFLASGPNEFDAAPTHRDAPAFWLYSSGSTGAPKACVHLQHDMVVCAELYGKGVLGIRASDRTFSVAKLFFAYGLGNALYFPFSAGATTILWPGAPTPGNVYAVIERHRPTIFYSVPTGYGMMLAEQGDFDLSSVRCAVSAGEALPPALFERFQARFGIDILDGIGSTEALHMFISNRADALRPGSSGVVVPGYDARVLDDRGVAVPEGEIGNLWISGDSTCAGYWNQHEKTKDTIEGRWIRTGDKFSRDSEGFFWYAGRSDDMLKVGGLWVSPIEVENAMLAHTAVLECGVIGREDRDGLTKPMAFVVLKPGATTPNDLAAELQRFVRDRIAEYKRPRWVEIVPELPKTATGKIQRYRLREQRGDP